MIYLGPIARPSTNDYIVHTAQVWGPRMTYLNKNGIDLTPLMDINIFSEKGEEWWKEQRDIIRNRRDEWK